MNEMLSSLEETARYARKQKEVALPLAKAVVHHAKVYYYYYTFLFFFSFFTLFLSFVKGEYDAAYDDMGLIYDRIKEVCNTL